MNSILQYVRLIPVPRIRLTTSRSTAEIKDQNSEIRSLIDSLASTSMPGAGYSDVFSGYEFPPVPSHYNVSSLLLGIQRPALSETFKHIVSLGGIAIPTLLDALQEVLPTKLKFYSSRRGTLIHQLDDILWNPFSQNEKEVWKRYNNKFGIMSQANIPSYTVTVGDLCFVALGQIVGRPYSAVRYQPSGLAVISMASSNPALCSALRAAWGSSSSDQMLLDSLLCDFSIRGIYNGQLTPGWGIGSSLQTEAAMRLLYYYPDYVMPLIVRRLDDLNVDAIPSIGLKLTEDKRFDLYMRREIHNGVNTVQFINSVAWCKDVHIQKALSRIIRRTTDKEIVAAITAQI